MGRLYIFISYDDIVDIYFNIVNMTTRVSYKRKLFLIFEKEIKK